MAYDSDGIRVKKTKAGKSTDYLTDLNRSYAQVLYERGANSELSYTFGLDLLSLSTGSDDYTYHTDALGSTRALTGSTGVLSDDIKYDAWGKQLAGGSVGENHYTYTGEQFDVDLGKLYLRPRYYTPTTARFEQMDEWLGSVKTPFTQNKYSYVHNDPANLIDPSGHFSLASTSTAQTILGIMSRTASAAIGFGFRLGGREFVKGGFKVALEMPKWRLYSARKKLLQSIADRAPHWFIYAEKIGIVPRNGYRFDVGVDAGINFSDVAVGFYTQFDGQIQASRSTRSEIKKENKIGKKIASLTHAQYSAWKASVVGEGINECELQYSLTV